MQGDQFKMDRIITAAALPCIRKKQDTPTTSIETLLLRLTDIQTSLNANITRTDNNAHELIQLILRLDTQLTAIQTHIDQTTTDIEYDNRFNRPSQEPTTESPNVHRLEIQIAELMNRFTSTTASEKEFRQINSVTLAKLNTTIQFVESQLLTTNQKF